MDSTRDIRLSPPSTLRRSRQMPGYLVREMLDGRPFYYRGYREVLRKCKTLEELTGDGGWVFFLKNHLADLLGEGLDPSRYRVGAGQLGFAPDAENQLELDVVVFDCSILTPDKVTTKFVDVPVKYVIEVDVNVELPERQSDLFQEYLVRKVQRLFDFGTDKVVWIFTKSRKVLSATPDAPWQFFDWDQDIELFEGVRMNIAAYIAQEGFNADLTAHP